MPTERLREDLRRGAPHLSVGILTADWMSIGAELNLLMGAGVRLLHFDVMDGSYCPMLTLGPPVIKGLKTTMLKDVHLMIEEPQDYVAGFVAAGADIVTVHAESSRHVHRALQELGTMRNANDPDRGIIRGVALNPGTPLEAIDPLLEEVDLILLLAVNPGWGGQKFIPATHARLACLKQKVGDKVLLGVDGGITRENVAEVARLGADIIVTGSAVFDGKSPRENVAFMQEAISQ